MKAKPEKRSVVVALFLVVGIPVFLVIFFNLGTNHYKPLPFIGKREGFTAKGDTIFQKVPDFSLTDQTGHAYGTNDLKGHIYIADFFFTSCPNICPTMTKTLVKVQEKFKGRDIVRILSFSLDPKRDSAARLATYARQYGINNTQWHLLTGDKNYVLGLMPGFLLQSAEYGKEEKDIYHSEFMLLVDEEGHIRGVYNGAKNDEKELERMEEDIHTLALSYERSK